VSVVVLLVLVAPACGRATTPTSTEAPELATEEAIAVVPATAPERLFQWEYEDEQVYSVAFSPDGALVAGGSKVWQVHDGALAQAIEYRHSVIDLAFSPDGQLLGAGLRLYGVQFVQVADGEMLHRIDRGFDYDNHLAFSPDGETVATSNRNGIVWLWRVADGELLAEFEPPDTAWSAGLAFSPDGEIVAAGHKDGTVYLWRASDGQLLHTLPAQTDRCTVNDLAFSPDGALLATVGGREEQEHVVWLWRVADGSSQQALPLPKTGGAVAFSPDGQWLAAGSGEKLMLWELSEAALWDALDYGAQIAESDQITSLDFSPNGDLLVIGRHGGILELWRFNRAM